MAAEHFQFEQFPVYVAAEEFLINVNPILRNKQLDRTLRDQLNRASISIVLTIAEGAGKYTKNDKKNFYVIARGSVHECAAILRICRGFGVINETSYRQLHSDLIVISKMLSGLINTMMTKN